MPDDGTEHSILTSDLAAADDGPLLRAAIEAIGDAVIITSPELDEPGPIIRYTNPAFTAMTGYASAEVIGRTPRLLQGPDTDPRELRRIRQELTAGGTFQGEGINYRKDGSTYVIDWLITPIRDPAGAVTAWLSIQRDITARKRSERRQSELAAELQHRSRNLLAVVNAIARRTMSASRSVDAFSARLFRRLAALGRVHGLLARPLAESTVIGELVRAELAALEPAPLWSNIALDGPAVALPDAILQTLTLALHELAANATEHGALANGEGRLDVKWHTDRDGEGDPHLTLEWVETGIPPPPDDWDPMIRGYGRQLIERALPHALRATVRYELDRSGLRCNVGVPLTGHRVTARGG